MVKQPFPPDDSSVGYARGTTVSREWEQAQMYAAAEIAGEVVKNLARLADFKEDSPIARERIKTFCLRFAERAFRRPLTEEQKQSFVVQYFAGEVAPEWRRSSRVAGPDVAAVPVPGCGCAAG